MILTTDRSDKTETRWWSILDLHPKKEMFLFDSFGFSGLEDFIIQDNKNVINKILWVKTGTAL